jgi:hypothetical protein
MASVQWSFEADYFTACNCDWGCPCNFNAPPTEGRCLGWGAWSITRGRYGSTPLDGKRFALYYAFPGPIEQGHGSACAYVDRRASAEQRRALEAIGTGKAGGGIFQLFGEQLVTRWLATKEAAIEFRMEDGKGRVRIEGFGEGESELLAYPDGTTIRPQVDLPHGIEYKSGLMTNAKRWWWRDEDLLAAYANKYGAVARVKFSEEGCVG